MPVSKLPRAVSTGQVTQNKSVAGLGGSHGMIRELVVGPTVSRYIALDAKIPANSRVDGYAIRCVATGAAGGTTSSIGLGTGASPGDPDQICELTLSSYDAVNDNTSGPPDTALWTTAETTISFAGLNGSGAIGDTEVTGSWDVTVFFTEFPISVAV